MTVDYAALFSRRHPFYILNADIWKRSRSAYGGGARYIRQALVRHLSEVEPEYMERLRRACYTNYPRRIATLITQYVLSVKPVREGVDAALCEDFSRTGMRVDEVMRQFCTNLSVYGCSWLAVDMPCFDGVKSKQDEMTERLRPYCVALSPLDVVDWCYGADGKLLWVLAAERTLDHTNPFKDAEVIEIRKLWTREDVTIYSKNHTTGAWSERRVVHGLGCVPFVRHVEVDGYGLGENHWFEDVVRISDAILNASSEAQMNVVKQMFGLLVIPEDFLDFANAAQPNGDESQTASSDSGNEPLSHVLARSAAIYESTEAKGCSRYISPSGAETTIIRSEIEAMKREMYSVVGLSSSKDTKMVETAEAKEWDFQNVEHYMATRADVLEQCETFAWQLLAKWNPAIKVPKVVYNRNFAIMDLKESVAALLELSGFNPNNDEYQRQIGKTALTMLNRLRQLPQEAQEAILQEINASTPGKDASLLAESMEPVSPDIDGESI